jgi:hypothetical protein
LLAQSAIDYLNINKEKANQKDLLLAVLDTAEGFVQK